MDIVKLAADVEAYLHWSSEPNDAGTKQQKYQEFVRNMYNVASCLIGGLTLWQPVAEYIQGQVILAPSMAPNSVAYVTKAGTSGTVEPSWTGFGTTVKDGTVTYTIKRRIIDFATDDDIAAGTSNNTIVTPAGLKVVADSLSSGTDTVQKNLNDTNKTLNATKTSLEESINGVQGNLDSAKSTLQTNIDNVKAQAGVIAGSVSNANAWWVKLGGTIPLIIQGGMVYTDNSLVEKARRRINFPVGYPAAILWAGFQSVQNDTTSNAWCYVTAYDRWGMNVLPRHQVNWLSFGY